MSKYKPLIRRAINEIDKVIRDDVNPTEDESLKFYYKYINLRFDTDEKKQELNKTRAYDNYARENKDFFKHMQKTLQHPTLVKAFGEVFTPSELVDDMLNSLPINVWKNPNLKWIDNSCGSGHFLVAIFKRLMISLKNEIPDKELRKKHILENMLYGVDIQAKNVFSALYVLDKFENYNLHIEQHDGLNFDYWNTKFDIVVGNPPYNDSSRSKLGGKVLWDKFVAKGIELLNDNGFLLYVHPPRWRNPGDELYPIFQSYNLIYANFNSYETGAKVFSGKGTNFDWYLLQKSKYYGTTLIDDIDNKKSKIDIQKWNWLPSGKFDVFEKLIAFNNDQKINILRSRSAYGTDKGSHMSREKTDSHIYPVVYYINITGDINLWWTNDNTIDHYGIPKIIYASGAGSLKGIFVEDMDGEYGMTQFSFGICDSLENLNELKNVLASEKFISLIPYMVISKNEFNRKALETFKSEFWKELLC